MIAIKTFRFEKNLLEFFVIMDALISFQFRKTLSDRRLTLELGTDLLNKDSHPFHSNTDENRLEVLNKALYSDEENLIIWCINGGYGSSKLIKINLDL